METPLNGLQMLEAVDGKAKVVLYPELKKYKDLDDLFGNVDCIFLLYEFERSYGHWTMTFRNGNNVEHFDSYNYKPDDEFNFIPEYFRKINDMMYPQLTKLLHDSKYNIHYNNYKLQSKSDNIATCGRHCIVRYWFKDLDIDKYYQMLKYIRKKTDYTFDEVMVCLTDKY